MTFNSIQHSETILTELMVPSFANFGGKVHGGILLSLMDKVAYVTAAKHCGAYAVTVAVEGVEFLHPVEVGDLVSLKASVNFVGNTSMIIGMRVEALNPRTGIVTHTNSCYFTMASKNEDGKLMQVPGLILENETHIRRFYEGLKLKEFALHKRKMMKSDFAHITLEEMKSSCLMQRCQIA